MFKFTQLPIALILLQLAACGAADQSGNPTTDTADGTGKVSSALGDACKKTEIIVQNTLFYDGRAREIRVEDVRYYSASEGRWYTEGLANQDILYNFQYTWFNQNLEHAENDLLTKWRVDFRYRMNDGTWSRSYYVEINTPDDTCLADDNYTLTVQ